MKTILQNDAATDIYTAPKCRVYTVALESVIAQSGDIPGEIPGDEYDDDDEGE